MAQEGPRPDARKASGRSRRTFLKVSSLALAAAAGRKTGSAFALPGADAGMRTAGRGNAHPGRIVLCRDPEMGGHHATINKERVAWIVHRGVRLLTDETDTGAAFEALFPGLHAGTRVAIKVNCVGTADTRWESVRGVVAGLALMLGGTYDVSQVAIYDRDSILGNGYPPGEFVFGGNQPIMAYGPDCSSSYYVYENHRLSNYILEYDYLINMPALKSHSYPLNQMTLAMKNHYGSCCPPSLCNNITGMLTVNADPHIKQKTALVLMDGLRGTYSGGPSQPPMIWNTFPEQTPNTLFFSTDPVTNEYWGRELINAERATHGWSPKTAPWIEEASGAPYNLGVSDPEQMTVLFDDPAYVTEEDSAARGVIYLAPNAPNPFRDTTVLRFKLPQPMSVRLVVLDAAGRQVRLLAERQFPGGLSAVRWDGCDSHGAAQASGVYFVRLETDRPLATRRIQLIQ